MFVLNKSLDSRTLIWYRNTISLSRGNWYKAHDRPDCRWSSVIRTCLWQHRLFHSGPVFMCLRSLHLSDILVGVRWPPRLSRGRLCAQPRPCLPTGPQFPPAGVSLFCCCPTTLLLTKGSVAEIVLGLRRPSPHLNVNGCIVHCSDCL